MLFSRTPPQPTQTKKIIYLIAWIILGILVGVLIYVFIEIRYFNWAQHSQYAQEYTAAVKFYDSRAFHPAIRIGLVAAGALFGFWQGKFWWRKVYIEQFWKKKFTRS